MYENKWMSLCILLEWVPPEPEPFYQPTGNEVAPEVMGEAYGTIVYFINSGNNNVNYRQYMIIGFPRTKKNGDLQNILKIKNLKHSEDK